MGLSTDMTLFKHLLAHLLEMALLVRLTELSQKQHSIIHLVLLPTTVAIYL
jgi:hypothetical protein